MSVDNQVDPDLIYDLKWVGVDLDHTIAERLWPDPKIGAPIERNIGKLREVAEAGYKIIIFTARPWSDIMRIENWLIKHDIPFNKIICGKLLVKNYFGDEAYNSEEESWLSKIRESA